MNVKVFDTPFRAPEFPALSHFTFRYPDEFFAKVGVVDIFAPAVQSVETSLQKMEAGKIFFLRRSWNPLSGLLIAFPKSIH